MYESILDSLDKKYLLPEVMEEANFLLQNNKRYIKRSKPRYA